VPEEDFRKATIELLLTDAVLDRTVEALDSQGAVETGITADDLRAALKRALDHTDTEMVGLPEGAAVLLDKLGVLPIETTPHRQKALLMELGGRLNKTSTDWIGQFLLAPKQGAELIANIVVAARTCGPEYAADIETELRREQERVVREAQRDN
jgi:hypothetical protein